MGIYLFVFIFPSWWQLSCCALLCWAPCVCCRMFVGIRIPSFFVFPREEPEAEEIAKVLPERVHRGSSKSAIYLCQRQTTGL